MASSGMPQSAEEVVKVLSRHSEQGGFALRDRARAEAACYDLEELGWRDRFKTRNLSLDRELNK